MAAPSHLDWRALARDLADDIARRAAKRGALGPAVLASIDGGAPAYFNHLFLAELFDRGVRIAETAEAPLRMSVALPPSASCPSCVAPEAARAPRPGRSLFSAFSLVTAYIAAAQRSLVAAARPEPPAEGTVIEVTG